MLGCCPWGAEGVLGVFRGVLRGPGVGAEGALGGSEVSRGLLGGPEGC